MGVAVIGVPTNSRALTRPFSSLEPYVESAELTRFVLLTEVPYNAESHFIGQMLSDVRARGVRGLVAFNDPVPRQTITGETVMPGHVGTIYRATNWTYAGRGTARRLTLLPDATTFSDRAAQKIRRRERGHEYATQQLVAHGATPPADDDDPRRWLAAALGQVGARRMRHPGNLRFCLGLDRHTRRELLARSELI